MKGLPDLGKPRKKADKADKVATDKAAEGSSPATQPAEPAAVEQAEGAKA